MAFELTPEQRVAVFDRGGGILVSAAAGSGKTRVLVERLLERITGEGRNIDEFLVITFTRAAAAELRARIAQELARRLALHPGDRHLRRQQTLVYKAQISTIHSFCTDLLRECGHLVDLEPDFRLCDEGEADVLMDRALTEVLESRYEGLKPEDDFAQLVDTMSAGRDDSRLVSIVLDIYHKIQSHPRPGRWLAEQEELFALRGVTDAGDTPWGALLLEQSRSRASYCRDRLAYALSLCRTDPVLDKAYSPSIAESLSQTEAFLSACERGWDAASAALPVEFPRLGAARKCGVPEVQERVKAIRDRCKKRLEGIAELLRDPSAELLGDLRAIYPAVRGLFALVRDFDRAYRAEKTRRGLLDFSDLEHLSVALLVNEDGVPTALARQWSGRYTEIMVDEYQDTNEVQNAIFSALSRGGANLFMVGDVKQSIYRFRLADPTIFLDKYRHFAPVEGAAAGEERRILLSRNFRSRPEVLEGVNYLFRCLMSREFGEMDYTEQESLNPGGTFPESGEQQLELAMLDLSGLDGDGPEDKVEKDLEEARYAARRIGELLASGHVTGEDGTLRPVRPEDVVILLRSPGAVLHHYARALGEADIPWQAEGAEDFFASTEVNVALSLLQIVDNPRQDVALISALRSPVFGFSGDRLAQLRAGAKGDFYTALTEAAGRGEADCKTFLEGLEELRFGAGDKSSHQLVWHIYTRTNLLGLFGAMPDGEKRQSHLLTLYELARSFESAGHRGLFGFLSHLERLRTSGKKISVNQTLGSGRGIQILSIHRSKGLEFPVVVLCGLTRQFNREDMKKPILFHPKLGIGPRRLERERMLEYPTLARLAVSARLESEMMAEELRLLYVAMTRAKDKLVMVCTLTGGMDDLARLEGECAAPVDPRVLADCASVGQWVLMAALARPEGEPFRTLPPRRDREIPLGPAWNIVMVTPGGETADPVCGDETAAAETKETGEELIRRLTWRYPWPELAQVPSKLTATQLKGRFLDEEVASETESARTASMFDAPDFDRNGRLTPAQRGTALHLALQYMDFSAADSIPAIRAQVEDLVSRRLLTPQQGEAVDAAALAAFFRSDLGRELQESSSLHREFKFSILVPAADYYPGVGEGERVLLQGVVDCWFETADGLTVVDFKTDRVDAAGVSLWAERYRPQLEAYSRALTEITGKPVTRRLLWFFGPGVAVVL